MSKDKDPPFGHEVIKVELPDEPEYDAIAPTTHKGAYVYWQDQAEYYFVCGACYSSESHTQWSGSTRVSNWEKHQKAVYEAALKIKTCEWCGAKID